MLDGPADSPNGTAYTYIIASDTKVKLTTTKGGLEKVKESLTS